MKAITFLVLSLIFISAPIVRADGTQSTITYTGTPFTDGSVVGGIVQGTLTINGTLPANAFFLTVIPSDFSFSDGLFNYFPQNSSGFFEVTTDANGNITGWFVTLDAVTFPFGNSVEEDFFDLTSSWSNGVGFDEARLEQDNVGFDRPHIEVNTSTLVGAWTVTETTVTPEPSTYLLFLSGMGLIFYLTAKRRTTTPKILAHKQPGQ